MNKWTGRILWMIAVALVIGQIIVAAFYTVPKSDALYGLKIATSIYEGGGFVISAPAMSILGLISRIVRISPVKLALNILPFVILPLCYFAYGFLAKSLSEGPVKTPAILIFTELLNIYGYSSDALSPYTLLLGWYRGGAILVHLILPLVAAFIIRWRDKHPLQKKEDEGMLEEEDSEDDMKHKILNVRNLSIALAVFVIIVIGAVFVLNKKINNLHEATLSLQDIIESKGEFIEFKGALGDAFRGYIVVDAEDNVTVVFGGRYEDGEALLEILSRYDKHVTSWYIMEDGEQGAFEYCRDNGVAIEHIYSVGGIEELK